MGKPKQDPPPPPNACIMCMKRTAAPHNGGLCEVCAPPLKAPRTRAYLALRGRYGSVLALQLAAALTQPASYEHAGPYRLGA